MRALKTIRLRLRSLLGGRRVDRELDEELHNHLERDIERHIAAGLSRAEARTAALRAFGNVALVQEQVRDTWRVRWVEELGRDLVYALRSMTRTPLLSLVAIASLAAAIGANTATFSVVNTLMLRDLPVADPDQLVELAPETPVGPGNFSYPMYEHVRDHSSSFTDLVAVSSPVFRAEDGTDESPVGRYASGNFFDALGLQPALGRLLIPSDDQPSTNGATVAVISWGLWLRKFGGDPAVIGKTLEIGGAFGTGPVPFTIVGVLPRTFHGLTVGRSDDFYVPLTSEPRVGPRSLLGSPGAGWIKVVGRLKEGVSRTAAESDVNLTYQRFIDEFAGLARAEEVERLGARPIVVSSARAGLSGPRREFERPVLLLTGAVALVLLVACANVVNLLLARGFARRAEIGVRVALGSSRGRLVRQLLAESAVLGLLGGAVGLVFAVWGTPGIATLMANEDPAIAYDVAPDRTVLAFTLLLSLGSALAAGLVPALRLSRANAPSLRQDVNARGGGRALTLWTRGLIASQVALSALLLAGAFLLVTTLRNLRTDDFGFEREGVVEVWLSPGRAGYTGERRVAYLREVLQRVRAMPGVQSAAVSLGMPVWSTGVTSSFGVEGRPQDPDDAVFVNEVSEGYFATTGTRLLLGRDFGPSDRPDSTPVAIVSDALVRRHFGSANPIGRRINVGIRGVLEIVGVVETTKHESLREIDSPIVYGHALQGGNLGSSLHLAVKAAGNAAALGRPIRLEVERIAPVPVGPPVTLAAQIDRTLVKERLVARVLGGFALLAVVLAAAGLYGVLAYSVTRRTREIGIRVALGATRAAVLRPVLAEATKIVALGVVIGVPAALALTRVLTTLLYGVTPADASVLAEVIASLFLVALAAAIVPAWRASRVDPLVALRSE